MKHWKLPLAAALAVMGLQACDINVREAPRTTVNAPQSSLPDDAVLRPGAESQAQAPAQAPATDPSTTAALPPGTQPQGPVDATPGAAPTPPDAATQSAQLPPGSDPQTAAMGAPPAAGGMGMPMAGVQDGVAAPTELQRFFEESAASANGQGKSSENKASSENDKSKAAGKDAKVSLNLPAVRNPGDPDGARLLAQRRLEVPVAGIEPASLNDQYELSRGSRMHEAIDIVAPAGTPVVAVDDGHIAKLFTSKAGGLTVYQFSPDQRLAYYYAHLQGYAKQVREGAPVRRGDLIGYVGTTGNADPRTPHLHFAVFKLGNPPRWWQGDAVNPYPALSRAEPADQVAMR